MMRCATSHSRFTLSPLAVGMAVAALTTFAADQGPTNATSHVLGETCCRPAPLTRQRGGLA